MEEDTLTKLTHLANKFFDPAVVGNGVLQRAGFAVTSQPPCIGGVGHQAAWGDYFQPSLFRTIRSLICLHCRR